MASERKQRVSFAASTIVLEREHETAIRCRTGLWAVFAPTRAEAEREARHYFWQYAEDGEYDIDPKRSEPR